MINRNILLVNICCAPLVNECLQLQDYALFCFSLPPTPCSEVVTWAPDLDIHREDISPNMYIYISTEDSNAQALEDRLKDHTYSILCYDRELSQTLVCKGLK